MPVTISFVHDVTQPAPGMAEKAAMQEVAASSFEGTALEFEAKVGDPPMKTYPWWARLFSLIVFIALPFTAFLAFRYPNSAYLYGVAASFSLWWAVSYALNRREKRLASAR